MQSIIAFGNKVEGRDKVLKLLQYGARFLRTAVTDKVLLDRLNGLFAASRDARKMFRLAKSINEYDTITKLLPNSTLDSTTKTLQLLTRSAFFVYWIFDNLGMLSTMKVVKFEAKVWSRPAMTAWLIAILFSLIQLVRSLLSSYAQESQLRSASVAKGSEKEISEKLEQLLSTRRVTYLNIIKNLGDVMPAATGSEIPQRIVGKSFPERWCGFGGALSAAISCYQAWQ